MGGHLTELLQLESLFNKYDSYIITEYNKATLNLKNKYKKVFYLKNITKDHMIKYILLSPINIIKSFIYFIKIKPDIIITTGAHTAVAICFIAKIFKKKVIYIESFANINTKSLSGKLVSKIADKFIVQWEDMLKLYPNAINGGWIF